MGFWFGVRGFPKNPRKGKTLSHDSDSVEAVIPDMKKGRKREVRGSFMEEVAFVALKQLEK